MNPPFPYCNLRSSIMFTSLVMSCVSHLSNIGITGSTKPTPFRSTSTFPPGTSDMITPVSLLAVPSTHARPGIRFEPARRRHFFLFEETLLLNLFASFVSMAGRLAAEARVRLTRHTAEELLFIYRGLGWGDGERIEEYSDWRRSVQPGSWGLCTIGNSALLRMHADTVIHRISPLITVGDGYYRLKTLRSACFETSSYSRNVLHDA